MELQWGAMCVCTHAWFLPVSWTNSSPNRYWVSPCQTPCPQLGKECGVSVPSCRLHFHIHGPTCLPPGLWNVNSTCYSSSIFLKWKSSKTRLLLKVSQSKRKHNESQVSWTTLTEESLESQHPLPACQSPHCLLLQREDVGRERDAVVKTPASVQSGFTITGSTIGSIWLNLPNALMILPSAKHSNSHTIQSSSSLLYNKDHLSFTFQ